MSVWVLSVYYISYKKNIVLLFYLIRHDPATIRNIILVLLQSMQSYFLKTSLIISVTLFISSMVIAVPDGKQRPFLNNFSLVPLQ